MKKNETLNKYGSPKPRAREMTRVMKDEARNYYIKTGKNPSTGASIRYSGDDKSRQNPNFRSSIAGYVKNAVKEAKDFGRAYKATGEMSNTSGRGTDSAANKLRKKQDQEMGQFFGALLQGRRYR